jgi:wyosine [tRNA(Phe)-imidazoG37] synthetase (radical SAM superfamily)
MMSYVFGPVPSRRLGRSLGIDLVPFKTCTYDCIYCQCGRTTCKTVERTQHAKWEPVLKEIGERYFGHVDYVTLSGAGEPTLCTGLGELIERIKAITSLPVAVLTNGSLLWREDVRKELRKADLVVPSLDAGDESHFRYVNRPHDSISFAQMVEGLRAFRQECCGQYWIEVFLLAGYTSVESEVNKIAECVARIRPDRVQLNTVTRPASRRFAEPVSRDQLARLACLFLPQGEVIADYAHRASETEMSTSDSDVLNLLRRRPCSVQDVVSVFGLHTHEVIKQLENLYHRGLAEPVVGRKGVYYRAVRPDVCPTECAGG